MIKPNWHPYKFSWAQETVIFLSSQVNECYEYRLVRSSKGTQDFLERNVDCQKYTSIQIIHFISIAISVEHIWSVSISPIYSFRLSQGYSDCDQ